MARGTLLYPPVYFEQNRKSGQVTLGGKEQFRSMPLCQQTG
jgi:hypothetical protein